MDEALHVSKDEEFPEARSVNHRANFDVLDQEQQEAWEYYLGVGDKEREKRYQGPERRSRMSQINREVYSVAGRTMTASGEEERKELINEFQTWAPITLAEGRDFLYGGRDRINRAENTTVGNGDRAVEKRFRSYRGYLLDAEQDLFTLQQVMTHPEGGDSYIDPSLFRSSKEAQEVLVKQLMSRNFLWDQYEGQWPSVRSDKYKERKKYWNGFITEAVKGASDEALSELLRTFYERAKARYIFSKSTYSQIEKIPNIKAKIESGQLLPHIPSRLLHEKSNLIAQEIRSNLPAVDDKIGGLAVKEFAAAPKPKNIDSFDELIPEAEEAKMLELVAEFVGKSNQIERYVQHQGMSRDIAERRVLGGPAQRYKGYVIGIQKEDKDDQPNTEQLVRHELAEQARIARRRAKLR